MLEKATHERYQQYLHMMLRDFDALCSAYDVKYSLAFGTMLGAVRHQDFIPWDDDIDVYMTRENYHKFQLAIKKESKKHDSRYRHYYLWGLESFNNYFYGYLAKFCDSRTLLVEKKKREVKYGAFIDIFVLDRLPKSLSVRFYVPVYKLVCRGMIGLQHRQVLRSLVNAMSRFLDRWAFMGNSNGVESYINIGCSDRWGKRADYVFPEQWIEEFVSIKFGDYSYPVFKEYKAMLSRQYGNYMELPPLDKRYVHDCKVLLPKEDNE